MNSENTREKKLEKLFAQNPKIDTLYLTADDQAFVDENAAYGHTSRLSNKDIDIYERKTFKDAFKAVKPKADADLTFTELKSKYPEVKARTKKEFLEILATPVE